MFILQINAERLKLIKFKINNKSVAENNFQNNLNYFKIFKENDEAFNKVLYSIIEFIALSAQQTEFIKI